LNPFGVRALPLTEPFLEGLLFVADLLRALCNICPNKLSSLSLRSFPPLKPFKRRDHSTDIHGRYSNAAPADVAPAQRAGPHLNPSGVGALPPTMLFLERLFFVADLLRTLCNIRLNKLTTLSLRLFPPLKPFERRDQYTDIYGGY